MEDNFETNHERQNPQMTISQNAAEIPFEQQAEDTNKINEQKLTPGLDRCRKTFDLEVKPEQSNVGLPASVWSSIFCNSAVPEGPENHDQPAVSTSFDNGVNITTNQPLDSPPDLSVSVWAPDVEFRPRKRRRYRKPSPLINEINLTLVPEYPQEQLPKAVDDGSEDASSSSSGQSPTSTTTAKSSRERAGVTKDKPRSLKSLGPLDEIDRASRAASPAKRTRAEMEVRDETAEEEKPGLDIMAVDSVRQGKSKRAATTLKNDASSTADESGTAVSMSRERSTSSFTGGLTSRMRNASFENSDRDETSTATTDVKSEHSLSSDTTLRGTPATMLTDVSAPSLDEHLAEIVRLSQQPLVENMTGYVIPASWLENAKKHGSGAKGEHNEELFRLDNAGLLLVLDLSITGLVDEHGQPFLPLRPGLQVGSDIEIIPKDAWQSITLQFGKTPGSKAIVRYCHNTSGSDALFDNLSYEVYPPIFTLLKIPNSDNTNAAKLAKDKELAPVKMQAHRSEPFTDFLRRARNRAQISPSSEIRVWRILGGLKEALVAQPGLVTPLPSRSNSPVPPTPMPNGIVPVDPGKSLVLDPGVFIELAPGSQRELIEAPEPSSQAAASVDLDAVGLGQEGVLVLEERTNNGTWVSVHVAETVGKLNGTSKAGKRGRTAGIMGRASPSPGGPNTRGRAARSGRVPGTVGLGNLGNSCYMNSALQCVRSIAELTEYFLRDAYKRELNPRNPLGHNGDVAKAYASLLRELYKPDASGSFSPRNFKSIIGKYGPSFSGYGQQDSQEFVLFLLDGLQEDLNRISKKPYIEKPDSTDEMVHDPKALTAFADKCWEIYKARNDSVIADLCAGQYKSTLHCPVCDKVSIIFDPFNNLTLQLPMQSLWSRHLIFFPLHSRPIKIDFDIDQNATVIQLKELIGKRMEVEPRKLAMAEIFNNKFYKVFDDKFNFGEDRGIPDSDVLAMYELEDVPTNTQRPKRKSGRRLGNYGDSDSDHDPEMSNCLLIPLVNQRASGSNSLFGQPSFITLTREEAKDYNVILAKVLVKVATMTTRKLFDDDTGVESEDNDMVTLNNSDLESSEANIQSHSVSDDDGMVEISVRPSVEEESSPHVSYPPQPIIVRTPPVILTKDGLVSEKLRSLFELRFYPKGGDSNVGIRSFDAKSRLKTVLSRLKSKKIERVRKSSGSSEEMTLKPQFKQPPRIPPRPSHSPKGSQADVMTDDEEDQGVAISERPGASTATMSKSTMELPERNKKIRQTYGKHNRRNSFAQLGMDGAADSADDSDNLSIAERKESRDDFVSEEPLLLHGEGLVLDWTDDAYEGLFGATNKDKDDLRGMKTGDDIPLLSDPALDQARLQRRNKKRQGVLLDDCLDEFQKEEVLSEGDEWYCPRCKEHRRASKKFELWKCPDILIIHLKRFTSQGRLRDKLDLHVDFPTEGLDLTHRVVDTEGKEMIYDLFAVDNHYGGLGGGHYTAYAKNAVNESWYDYNDNTVTRLHDPQHVVTSAAYLLFYRRRKPEILGGPILEKFIAANENSDDDSTKAASRSVSPNDQSGEGRGLDYSPRNGYSSALSPAAAVRRTGLGGRRVIPEDDDEDMDAPLSGPSLPPMYPSGIQHVDENAMYDIPNSSPEPFRRSNFFKSPVIDSQPSWGFDRLNSLRGDQDHMSDVGDLDSLKGNTDADEQWPDGMDVENDYDDRTPDDEGEVVMVGDSLNLQQDDEHVAEFHLE